VLAETTVVVELEAVDDDDENAIVIVEIGGSSNVNRRRLVPLTRDGDISSLWSTTSSKTASTI
jgi:hypothetical protein